MKIFELEVSKLIGYALPGVVISILLNNFWPISPICANNVAIFLVSSFENNTYWRLAILLDNIH